MVEIITSTRLAARDAIKAPWRIPLSDEVPQTLRILDVVTASGVDLLVNLDVGNLKGS